MITMRDKLSLKVYNVIIYRKQQSVKLKQRCQYHIKLVLFFSLFVYLIYLTVDFFNINNLILLQFKLIILNINITYTFKFYLL